MATITFAAEIINEITGHALDFEFDYEVFQDPDMTREEIEEMADDFASFRDQEVLGYIMDNISIVLDVRDVIVDDE